jgi:hypothetical protein
MKVVDGHGVTEDRFVSRDWTSIGSRILEAATLASAVHLEELTRRDAAERGGETANDGQVGWIREISDGNG